MDQSQLTRAWLEVNLDAIRRNAQRLAQRAGSPIVAMLKADAYGLGATAVARALCGLTEVWGFGVATVEEGAALRRARIDTRLLCCTPVLNRELLAMHAERITPSLSRAADIATWVSISNAPWHLSIDSGMNRAGVQWNEAGALRGIIATHPPEGAFTHFAAAAAIEDISRAHQEARFAQALESAGVRTANPNVLLHVDSSVGLAARSPSPYDLARPGVALYGWPSNSSLGVEPAFVLRASVIDMRTVPAGDGVSYNGTWVADSPRMIATISIGHADGYRRQLSNAGQVLVSGTRCNVVGIVTMDMIMVDVTGVACAVGDVATLIGGNEPNAPSLDEVAAWGNLSPYELLVGLRMRLARVYTRHNDT
ncbi:MAG: alanine racemase [Gemmatimonadota bacterium]|nr:alanine racemase [Gemmatimonadota bacterium]